MAHQRRRRSTVMVHAERQRDVEMPERPLEQVGQIFGDEIYKTREYYKCNHIGFD